MSESLGSHRERFDEHDLFLHAVLGLMSHAASLERRLQSVGSVDASAPPRPTDTELEIVLGCVAVARRLTSKVGEVCPPVAASDDPAPGASWGRTLLR